MTINASADGKRPYAWPQEEAWDGRLVDVGFAEFEPESFPFALRICPVCKALVRWGDAPDHKDWHVEKESADA